MLSAALTVFGPVENGFDIWDYLPAEWSMRTVYLVCAVLGGSVLLLQFFLLLFGLGHVDAETEFDAGDSDHSDALGLLSVRAVAGFFSFFGLAGLMGHASGWSAPATLGIATAAGLATFFVVAWLFTLQKRLHSEGNVRPEAAVGLSAVVYLRIPGARAGKGQITVTLQGRELQYAAVTSAGELPTGSEVRIVGMTTEDTFDVVPLHAVAS